MDPPQSLDKQQIYLNFVNGLGLYCIPRLLSIKLEKTLENVQAGIIPMSGIDRTTLGSVGGLLEGGQEMSFIFDTFIGPISPLGQLLPHHSIHCLHTKVWIVKVFGNR
jgi:hypothetical protein